MVVPRGKKTEKLLRMEYRGEGKTKELSRACEKKYKNIKPKRRDKKLWQVQQKSRNHLLSS